MRFKNEIVVLLKGYGESYRNYEHEKGTHLEVVAERAAMEARIETLLWVLGCEIEHLGLLRTTRVDGVILNCGAPLKHVKGIASNRPDDTGYLEEMNARTLDLASSHWVPHSWIPAYIKERFETMCRKEVLLRFGIREDDLLKHVKDR